VSDRSPIASNAADANCCALSQSAKQASRQAGEAKPKQSANQLRCFSSSPRRRLLLLLLILYTKTRPIVRGHQMTQSAKRRKPVTGILLLPYANSVSRMTRDYFLFRSHRRYYFLFCGTRKKTTINLFRFRAFCTLLGGKGREGEEMMMN